MLAPEDRVEAIEVLADFHLNKVVSTGYSGYSNNRGTDVRKLLVYGFKGFASFTDKELLDQLMKIRDQHYQASTILTRVAENELLK